MVLALLKKLYPVAREAALYAVDGKITKEELYAIADDVLGEDGEIVLWGNK